MGYSVTLNDDLLAFSEGLFATTQLQVDTGGPPGHGIQLRLSQIREIRAIEPWPGLYIAWSTKHLSPERTLAPPPRRFGMNGPTETQLEHERMVVELIERLKANPRSRGIRITEGWAGFPHVEWDDVEGFPDGAPVGEGAFRSSADPDHVVARRGPPSPLEATLMWLASSPERRLVDTPQEVVLTREHIYVSVAKKGVRVLPRDTLRRRKGEAEEDAVYIFGRRTRLVLAHREGCEVRAALDAQLAERGEP